MTYEGGTDISACALKRRRRRRKRGWRRRSPHGDGHNYSTAYYGINFFIPCLMKAVSCSFNSNFCYFDVSTSLLFKVYLYC
jgi:hypothetical protein